ncbi:hypothetical protein [Lichenicoccus roseus]|uniref:hypothetical protein n=1 Tax=Lichenicoccus roseus TaxID=2683649 RepID=UPI0019825B44|nr:hypothetical protein [Lichenicoccus roseus]
MTFVRLMVLAGLLLPLHVHAATRKAHHGGAPVILTRQPGTAADQAARTLNREDLQGAARHGETPLVLVGSAPLSDHRTDEALFVQLQSASLCGSAGCSTSVYLRRDHEWTKVLDSVSGPIRVMPQSNDGMHDLLVGRNDRWTWSGGGYRDTLAAPPLTGLKRSVEQHRAAVRRHQDPTTN